MSASNDEFEEYLNELNDTVRRDFPCDYLDPSTKWVGCHGFMSDDPASP